MTQDPHQAIIHYDTERVDYSLSSVELEQLSSSSQNQWKDFCIACLAVATPCTITTVTELSKHPQATPTLSFVLNLVVGIIGIVLGTAFGRAWLKSKSPIKELVKRIKDRPKMKIPLMPEMTDVGALKENDDERVE